MSATSAPATPPNTRSDGPGSAFTAVLNAAVGGAASKMDDQVSRWTDRLNGIASGERSSPAEAAGVAGAKASLQGRNPFWAAVRGLWSAGSPAVRAAVVTALVATILLLVTSPVLLLVFLVSLLVIAAVQRAMRAAR